MYFSKIISDNHSIRRSDIRLLPHLADRYYTLYTYVEDGLLRRVGADTSKRRVLWAFRLDAQKRPALLPAIATELQCRLPNVVLDVYGSAILGGFDPSQLSGRNNLVYRGPFAGFGSLPLERYDIFLYTSAFDGLPNVILEAMTAGLVVIAADVGGIAEAVTHQTGFLLDSALPDGELAEAYVAAIAACYANPEQMRELRTSALNYVAARHQKQPFGKAVEDLFGRSSMSIKRAA